MTAPLKRRTKTHESAQKPAKNPAEIDLPPRQGPSDPKDELTGAEYDTVMDSILAKNVFDSNGTDLEAKVRAEVVSRSVDVLEEF